jgi:hypothetical protein
MNGDEHTRRLRKRQEKQEADSYGLPRPLVLLALGAAALGVSVLLFWTGHALWMGYRYG